MKNNVQPITKKSVKQFTRKDVLPIMRTNVEQNTSMNVKEAMFHKLEVPLVMLVTEAVEAIVNLFRRKFVRLLLYLIVDKLQMNRY